MCAVDNSKRGITRGVISAQIHPMRAGTGTALIAVGTSSGTVAVLEASGRCVGQGTSQGAINFDCCCLTEL